MKLIDILVRDLPGKGGWPKVVEGVEMPIAGNELITSWRWNSEIQQFVSCTYGAETVLREQYEIALAASRKQWNGHFPIPAGTEVEVHFDGDDSRVWTHFRVEYMAGEVVVLHDYRIDNVDAYKHKTLSFRPILSEADKKRTEAIHIIADLCRDSASNGHSGQLVYDAIAAGKIPGISIK